MGGPYDDAAVRLRAVLAVHSAAVVFHPPLPAAGNATAQQSTGALPGALAALFDESPANQGDPECPLEHRGFVLFLAASPTALQAQHVWQSSLVLGDLVLDGSHARARAPLAWWQPITRRLRSCATWR